MSMLDVEGFLATIYLGDRACKALHVDTWNREIRLYVDEISRIRSATGDWDYYTDEDIVDGSLVFTGVSSFRLQPSGPLPNDLINAIKARRLPGDASGASWIFEISIDSVAANATRREVILAIEAQDLHLEDPARPGVKIRD